MHVLAFYARRYSLPDELALFGAAIKCELYICYSFCTRDRKNVCELRTQRRFRAGKKEKKIPLVSLGPNKKT